MKIFKNQSGVSLIAAIFIIVILAFMGMVFLTLFTTTSSTSINELQSTQALYVAEGGMERAIYDFRNGTNCSLLSYTNSLGLGSFTTTGALYNPFPFTTLSSAISNTDTTIPLTSSAGYANQGRIRIDSEEIIYSGISGNNLTNALRGAAGTTATNHSSGASVFQNQCRISSTGTVSNAVRQLERNVVGMSTKQGSFITNTSNGNQSITGIGFRPKAVIFFWTRQTATGFIAQNSRVSLGVGFATGPANERAVSVTARDRRNSSDDGRRRSESNTIVLLTDGGPPSLVAQAGLTSLDADGFTLNWTTTDGNAYIVHYIALGGDITNALASTFTLTTGAGNQSIGGVGFQPDFVMFLWSHTENVDTDTGNSEIGISFAQSSTARGALVYAGRDGNGNNTQKRWQQRTNAVILLLRPNQTPPDQDAVADFVSMDANGFTINKSDGPAGNTPIFYLAIKGGRHNVGTFNQPAVTGDQAVTGVGFKPQELMLASFNLTAQAGIVGGGAISLGAAQSSSSRGSVWFQDRSDCDPSDANSYTSTTDVLTLAYGTATCGMMAVDGNPTVRARADFVSFDPDGFTLNWTTADATQRQILYWAVGPNVNATNIMWREVFQ